MVRQEKNDDYMVSGGSTRFETNDRDGFMGCGKHYANSIKFHPSYSHMVNIYYSNSSPIILIVCGWFHLVHLNDLNASPQPVFGHNGTFKSISPTKSGKIRKNM